jgi:hypothetical protein
MFPSLHLFVLESALQAHDAGLLPTDLLPPLVPTLRRAVMEVNPLHRAACEDAVAKILDKHQLKIRLGIPQGSAHGGLNIPRKIYNVVRENAFVEYAGSNHEFSNVYEAALRHDQLLLKRSSYLLRLLRNLGRKSISYLTRLGKSQANT